MLKSVPNDVWVGLVLMIGAVAYWFGADGIPISPLDGEVNAAALPKGLAYVLAILSLLMILRAYSVLWLQRRAKTAPAPSTDEPVEGMKVHVRALGILAIGFAYLLVLPYLGYLISVGLLIFSIAAYMGIRIGPRLAMWSALFAVFFYVVFVLILGIPLPAGIWPNLFA